MYRLQTIFFLLLAITGQVTAQNYLYVNTDNLLLRDKPESTYVVFDILHAGSKLERDTSDKGYAKDMQVNARFYQVKVKYQEEGRSIVKYGWVEKKYVRRDKRKLTVPVADTSVDVVHTAVNLQRYGGGADPDGKNYLLYPYPKYKGGEKVFPHEEKRVYHKGPRGGCFYWKKGRKVYVEKRFCKWAMGQSTGVDQQRHPPSKPTNN